MSAARSLLALAATVVAAPVVEGQSIAELEARVHRLDSLVRVRREATRSEVPTEEMDTLRVGGFLVLSPRTLTATAREGAARAWERVRAAGGTWLARELPHHPIALARTDLPLRRLPPEARYVRASMALQDSMPPVTRTTASGRAEDLARTLEQMADVVAWGATSPERHLPSTFWNAEPSWASERLVLFDQSIESPPLLGMDVRAGSEVWILSQRSLRLTPSRSNRACAGGDANACLVSLGLSGTSRDAYDTVDYRWLLALGGLGMVPPALRGACRDRGDHAACASLARTGAAPRLPTTPEAQATFLPLVLELGGPEALERMAVARGSRAEILAAAAGRPLVEAAAEWQRRTMAAHLAPPSAQLPGVLVALGLGALVAWAASRRVSA